MGGKKHRLVTRGDFDGIVSGALFRELGLIDDVMLVEPGEVQDGKVSLTGNDITANLPYCEDVHLCFDHHMSELARVGKRANHVIVSDAPSTARVIYEYYGGKDRFSNISIDVMEAVDQADSAQYTEEDILAPTGWTMLNFIMDPRTGLSRFEDFTTSNEQIMKDLMLYCRRHSLDEIMALPDIKERLHTYIEHDEKAEHQINRCSAMHGSVVVTDFRDEGKIFACNRFMVYALYPKAKVSIQMLIEKDLDPDRTILAVGKSIVDRSAKVQIGSLMLEYGGGGHPGAGACRIPHADVGQVLVEIIEHINAAG